MAPEARQLFRYIAALGQQRNLLSHTDLVDVGSAKQLAAFVKQVNALCDRWK